MKKIVNVNAVRPISGVAQIVRGRLNNVSMSTEDIFKCLCAKATVTEVIGDTLIPLNFNNYNKNNKPASAPAVIPTTPVTTKTDENLSGYDKKNVDSNDEVPTIDTETPEVESATTDDMTVSVDDVVDTVTESTEETADAVNNAESDTPVIEGTTAETSEESNSESSEQNDNTVNNNYNNNNRKKHRR